MAALEAANHRARVGAPIDATARYRGLMGGRVKPGHDDRGKWT
jgi:hypothetical protein